jgi:hypothetical protein
MQVSGPISQGPATTRVTKALRFRASLMIYITVEVFSQLFGLNLAQIGLFRSKDAGFNRGYKEIFKPFDC